MAKEHIPVQVQGTSADKRKWRMVAMKYGIEFGDFVRRAITLVVKHPEMVLTDGEKQRQDAASTES